MKIAAAVEDSSCGIITRFTERDVLNGRGQGVQRHAGNVKYRTLVFVNKVSRYLQSCQRSSIF
jgi:hypothetical protein